MDRLQMEAQPILLIIFLYSKIKNNNPLLKIEQIVVSL
ncbi:hypothetical protein RV02_GL002748 [Enterococcus gilvus]|nr:hypothetical protein RV02_GL002748 [Enterococcus gilvus]